MTYLQTIFIAFYGFLAFLVFIKGLYESARKGNAFGKTPFLSLMGIFVWGDGVIFGLFWFLSSTIPILLKDWLLFLLIVSVFWFIRSLGETFYWINQQFSTINREPPEKLGGYSIFKNKSIWFVYQICNQCITVVSIITTIYLATLWLESIN